MDTGLMFLDCPAWMDSRGARRCALPAVVEYRYTVSTLDGLLEAAKIRCPVGHWFNAPIEVLAWPQHPAPTQTHQRRAA